MKKVIFIVLVCCIIACSSIYALYDPTQVYTDPPELPFTDLVFPKMDKNGRHEMTRDGKPLYIIHKYVNEIIKANLINIDKNNNKLIEGYKNPSGEKLKNISIDSDWYKKFPKSYKYAIDMTIKETEQAVEGLMHNLNSLQSRSGK